MAMGEEKSGSRDRVILPHPVLSTYYTQEKDRRRFMWGLFESTAKDYDWINAMMSFGMGASYRKDALCRYGLSEGMTVLDVAVGTGLTARGAQSVTGPFGRVIGIDPTQGMLDRARQCADILVVRGLAEELPVRDNTADFLTMTYALRHVRDLVVTFREYRRVLKPGGRLLLLELLCPPPNSIQYSLARLYLYWLVPWVAQVRGGKDAKTLMRYFWDTMEQCVPPPTILDALAISGFVNVTHKSPFGLCGEYVANKTP